MGQNGRVRRFRSSRSRTRRSWVDDAASPPPPAEGKRTGPPDAPTAATPDPHAPRRRYPWHDDPHYDPTAYRRPPGSPAPSWPPAHPTYHGGAATPGPQRDTLAQG